MCLLAVAKNRLLIPADHLQNAYDHNRDGWGTMYAQDGRVIAHKQTGDMTAFSAHWETLPKDRKVAVHFRFGTSGGVRNETCHPFQVLDKDADGMDLYLMHNGVVYGRFAGDKNESDTQKYVASIRATLKCYPELVRNPAWLADQEDIIGNGSKMVFLEGNGTFHYLNAKAGTQKGKVWYSNEYSLRPVYSGHGMGKRANDTDDGDWWQSKGYYGAAVVHRKAEVWFYDTKNAEWWKPHGVTSHQCYKRDEKGALRRQYITARGKDYVSRPDLEADGLQEVTIENVGQFMDKPATMDYENNGWIVKEVEVSASRNFPVVVTQSVTAPPEETKESDVVFDEADYKAQFWSETNLKTLTEDEMANAIWEDPDNATLALGAAMGCRWAFEEEEDAA